MFGWMTRGQQLSILMALSGIAILWWAYSRQAERH
jgi:prolipoprotein diacylglyceryltransferase